MRAQNNNPCARKFAESKAFCKTKTVSRVTTTTCRRPFVAWFTIPFKRIQFESCCSDSFRYFVILVSHIM